MDSAIVEAVYKYTYTDDDGSMVSFNEGDRFILLNKTSADWWKVQRTGVFSGKSICYVPALYMKEVNITPRGKSGFINQHVNMEVYRKIMKRDTEGLAKLGNKSMVVSKPIASESSNLPENGSIHHESDKSAPPADEKDEEDDDNDEDDDDDDAFDPSLDEIPPDICSLKLNISSDMSPEATPTSPLSFEISPRSPRMKSFTLPAGFKKINDSSSGRPYYYDEAKQKSTWKPPRVNSVSASSQSDLSQENIPGNIPDGWSVEVDPQNQENIYVNKATNERWKSCVNTNDQTYYYNMDGPGTCWNLPEVGEAGKPKHLRRKSFDETLEGVIRRQTVRGNRNKQNRNSKTRSVILSSPNSLSSDEGAKLKSPVTSPKPKKREKEKKHQRSVSAQSFEVIDMPESVELADNTQNLKTDKAGQLLRRKVVEGRKNVKKPVWSPIYCCKIGTNLVFYKDQKSASPKPGFPTGRPESSLDLHGAKLDHIAKEKVKGKKFVFQISSYGGQTVQQFVADNQVEMGEWIVCIQTVIQKLEEEDPLPPHPLILENGSIDSHHQISQRATSPGNHGGTLSPPCDSGRPTSPGMPKKLLSSNENKGFKGFGRRLSKRVTGGNNDDDKERTKIKDKLRKYLSKRPSFNELETKGIIIDFVFGYPLLKLCEREDTLVPRFIVSIVHEVERRGLDVDGIYRVSGNLSSINKLRGLIDNGENVNYSLPEWSDIHLLAGCLKLYFRELPEPLIPFNLFDKFVNAMKSPFKQEKMKILTNLLKEMPREHFETLNLLMTHFQKVLQHTQQNRMQSQNLSIVFGPTLLWPEKESLNMAMTTVYQNQLIEFLISQTATFFPG